MPFFEKEFFKPFDYSCMARVQDLPHMEKRVVHNVHGTRVAKLKISLASTAPLFG